VRTLPGILLWHPKPIEVELILVSFGEPQHNLVATREPIYRIASELEVPHDTIAQIDATLLLVGSKTRIEQHVYRNDLRMAIYVVTNFPADAAPRTNDSNCLINHFLLRPDIIAYRRPPAFIALADVVRRRGQYQLG